MIIIIILKIYGFIPTILKIYESAIHNQLYDYRNEHNFITPNQFSFRPKLSTVPALSHFTENILDKMDIGYFTGAIF